MRDMNPYDSYRHLLAIPGLSPRDYQAVSTLWTAYRKADKRAKRMEHILDTRTREFEAAKESET